MSTPGPGWYQDPGSPWFYRYWDGSAWTQHTAPTGAPAATGPAGGKYVPPLPFPAVRAEFGRRVLGYLIDALIITVPMFVVVGGLIALMFGVVFSTASSTSSTSDNPVLPSAAGPVFALAMLGFYALAFGLPLLYNGYFQSNGRRTVGQRVIGLRTVDARTGGPLTFGKAILRSLIAGIASGQVLGLGYWWALWDNEQRTWHDMAAGSTVIDEREMAPASGMLTAR